jgi:hypothetical protein
MSMRATLLSAAGGVRVLIPERRHDLERLTRRNRDRGVALFTTHPVGILIDDRIGVWVHAIGDFAPSNDC